MHYYKESKVHIFLFKVFKTFGYDVISHKLSSSIQAVSFVSVKCFFFVKPKVSLYPNLKFLVFSIEENVSFKGK